MRKQAGRITVSFTCTDTDWHAARQAWLADRTTHHRWNSWLDAALTDAIEAATLTPVPHAAPPRLTPTRRGNRTPPSTPHHRRSLTCPPRLWTETRNAWWTNRNTHPNLNDWITAAINAKATVHQHTMSTT